MNSPTTLDMMKKLSMDFPELWENAYSFQKISEHTLIVHTGTKTKKGIFKAMRHTMEHVRLDERISDHGYRFLVRIFCKRYNEEKEVV